MNRIKSMGIDRTDTGAWMVFTEEDRRKLYKRCGEKCFMVATGTEMERMKHPSKYLKFPICRPEPRKKCVASVSGLLAARRRAILTKKYPQLVASLTKIIDSEKLTKKARKEVPIIKIRLSKPNPQNKFQVRVVYKDSVSELLPTPLSANTIRRRYLHLLTPSQLRKLG